MSTALRLRLLMGAALALGQLSGCAGDAAQELPPQEGPFSGTWEASRALYADDDDSTSAPGSQPAPGEGRGRVYLYDDSSAIVSDAGSGRWLRGRWRHLPLAADTICIDPAPDTSRFGLVRRYASYCGKATAESDGRARELRLSLSTVGPGNVTVTVREVVLRRVDSAPGAR